MKSKNKRRLIRFFIRRQKLYLINLVFHCHIPPVPTISIAKPPIGMSAIQYQKLLTGFILCVSPPFFVSSFLSVPECLRPVVYISYARYPPLHSAAVILFAQQLHECGVRAVLDEFDSASFSKDCVSWVEARMLDPSVDFIMIVLSKYYPCVMPDDSLDAVKAYNEELSGADLLAAKTEVRLFKGSYHDKQKSFIPIHLGSTPPDFHIPNLLGHTELYNVDSDFKGRGWGKLLYRLYKLERFVPTKDFL